MKPKVDLKHLSRRELLEYIWDYYKLHIIGGLFCIFLLFSLISSYFRNSQTQLTVLMINNYSYLEHDETHFEEFMASNGYQVTENSIVFDDLLFTGDETYDYETLQKLRVLLAAGDSEIIFGNGELFDYCVEQGGLMDLREILSDELLNLYQDDFLYFEAENGTRYPCAVALANSPWAEKHPEYKDYCFGIPYHSDHEELAFELTNYLLQ